MSRECPVRVGRAGFFETNIENASDEKKDGHRTNTRSSLTFLLSENRRLHRVAFHPEKFYAGERIDPRTVVGSTHFDVIARVSEHVSATHRALP